MPLSYTIEIKNEEDIAKLKVIAKQNGIEFSFTKAVSTPSLDASGQRLADALNLVAQNGGLKSFGDNPSDWQREQRQDRSLIGRE